MDKVFTGVAVQQLQKKIEELQEDICVGQIPDYNAYVQLRGRLEGLIIARDMLEEIIRSFDTSQTD